jgi:rare lipoprotein A
VTIRRFIRSSIATAAAAAMAGCFSTRPPPPEAPPPVIETPPAPSPAGIPDAVPKYEPRSRYGNPPSYEVFGKRYYVLSSGVGYIERGVASWYGPGFHKVRTSTGEPYDMYAMTAAHKTLPLPAYVRVTNLQNGRSVVVRVNDRGPFVANRIIDLSYTAAAKLDMLRNGTAMVEIRSIDTSLPPIITAAAPLPAPRADANGAASPAVVPAPGTPASLAAAPPVPATAPVTAGVTVAANPSPMPAAAASSASAAAAATAPGTSAPTANAPPAALFIQAGAFADPANAERLAGRLRGGGYGKIFVRDDKIAGRRMYRVRIGPVPDVAEFDRVIAALERAGIGDAHLALE